MRKKVLPFMPVYPADVLCHPLMMRLSPEAFGSLWRLICHAWLDGGYVPDDEAELRRLTGSRSGKQWGRIRDAVLTFFDIREDNRRTNGELFSLYEEKLLKAMENSHKAREAANARWSKQSVEECM